MELAKHIEHTLLKPDTNKEQVKQLCSEAAQHGFRAVCVPPYYVKDAVSALEGSPAVKVVTVIGYPMGYSCTPSKVEEVKRAIDEGAAEVDVVVNISAIKDGQWSYVRNDINSSATAAQLKGKAAKIIFETSLLSSAEIEKLCQICTELEVNFVKTSTGHQGGASVEMVQFLRQHLPSTIKIKASGGIKTPEQAKELLKAGADTIGTSAGLAMI